MSAGTVSAKRRGSGTAIAGEEMAARKIRAESGGNAEKNGRGSQLIGGNRKRKTFICRRQRKNAGKFFSLYSAAE